MKVIEEYKNVLRRMIPLTIKGISREELERAMDYSIQKRFQDHQVSVTNNYKKTEVELKLTELMDFILDHKPILTQYGVMYSRHGTVPNPLSKMIDSFLATRAAYKKEMFKYPKGSEEFNKYNLLQLVAKVDVNAIYGAMGQAQAIFYNLYCAAGITSCGRGSISASITFFESFLENNVKFGSLNEIITFIDNVRNESRTNTDKYFRQIDVSECFRKIIMNCGYFWLPTENEMQIIWNILCNCSQQDINRIYYKNNLFEFCNNEFIQNMLKNMLRSLEVPFLNPNNPPEEIKEQLEVFLEFIKEYVYYGYMIIDKLDRIEYMVREAVLITDTDSCIVSFHHWYRYVLENTKDVDMKIKTAKIEVKEQGDDLVVENTGVVEPDYDFYNEVITERMREEKPKEVIPQDGLRHSIINILAYCIGQLILDYMVQYTKHYNSYADGKKCLLIMKNEFLFKALMLTDGKKNYASFQEVQEGNLVPPEAGLAISGLPLDKVNIPKSTSNELKRIIKDRILTVEDIDQVAVLKELAILEKKIYDSLISGETLYYKPLRIKAANAYKLPMQNEGIKGSVAYNELKRDNEEGINLESTNTVLIIKTKIDKKTIESIASDDKETYDKMKSLLQREEFKDGIKSIAIPTDTPVPEWIVPFINYSEIIHNNLNNFPLDSIGIHRFGNKHITYSNILEL